MIEITESNNGDYYVITKDGSCTFYRKTVVNAGDNPMSYHEETIASLCSHIINIEKYANHN